MVSAVTGLVQQNASSRLTKQGNEVKRDRAPFFFILPDHFRDHTRRATWRFKAPRGMEEPFPSRPFDTRSMVV